MTSHEAVDPERRAANSDEARSSPRVMLEGRAGTTEWRLQTRPVPDLRKLVDRSAADARDGTIDFWTPPAQDRAAPREKLCEGLFEGADGKLFKAPEAIFGSDGLRPRDGEPPQGTALLVPGIGTDAAVAKDMAQSLADRHRLSVFTVDTGESVRAVWHGAPGLRDIPQPAQYAFDDKAREAVVERLNDPDNRAVASIKGAITTAVEHDAPLDIVVASNGALLAGRAVGEATADLRRAGLPDKLIDQKLGDLIAIHRLSPSVLDAGAIGDPFRADGTSVVQAEPHDFARDVQNATDAVRAYGSAATNRFFDAMKEDVASTGKFLAQPAYVPAAQIAAGLHEQIVGYATRDAYDNNRRFLDGVQNTVKSAVDDPAGTLGKAVPGVVIGMVTHSAGAFVESKLAQQATGEVVRSGLAADIAEHVEPRAAAVRSGGAPALRPDPEAWREGTVRLGTGPAPTLSEGASAPSVATLRSSSRPAPGGMCRRRTSTN